MSYLTLALQSKEVEQAFGRGLSTWITTGSFAQGFDAMIKVAQANGGLVATVLAAMLDLFDGERR